MFQFHSGPGPKRREDFIVIIACIFIIGGVAAYLAAKLEWL